MATIPPPREETAEVVAAIAELLFAFAARHPFVLTSDSIAVLVKGLAPRLVAAAKAGRSVDLLRRWGRALDEGQGRLLEHATREAVSFDRGRAPLFTDNVARVALQLCPPDPDF
jgi:hypothetical protein